MERFYRMIQAGCGFTDRVTVHEKVSSLIDSLQESDEADVEPAWIEEVHKHARELETERVRGLTWAEARRIMLGT